MKETEGGALRRPDYYQSLVRVEKSEGRAMHCIRSRCMCIVLALLLAGAAMPAASGQAANLIQNFLLPDSLRQPQPDLQRRTIELPKKATRLDEMIPRMDYAATFLQPLPLGDVRIPTLTKKTVEMLGQNFFVVVDNTKYTTMSEVYRDNRLGGKSNYVTADAIVHPYLAFSNRVIADAIVEHIGPDLSSMLKAMLEKSLADYKQAEDAEVRDDIEHNISFLAVAVKLIDPKFFPSIPLRVVPMVQSDLGAIYKGVFAKCTSFDRDVDFSSFEPLGWYASSPELGNFYRCREWITQMSYPFADTAVGNRYRGNFFRRSALLYRALELATVGGQPAYDTWERLYKSWSLLGPQSKDWQENVISCAEYKSQLKAAGPDLKVTLNALAEPLFRTKLLLAVRRQKPLKLTATSVYDLDGSGGSSSAAPISFRLLPQVSDPEWPWLKFCTAVREQQQDNSASWPFSLLILHAWGAPQANNSLLDNYTKLDASLLAKLLPELDGRVMTRLPGGSVKPLDDRRWQILSAYFKLPPEGATPVSRSEGWMTRMLESAFAGWVDSHLAIAPASAASQAEVQSKADQAKTPAPMPVPATEPPAPPAPRRRTKTALFHSVQPTPEIFQNIGQDARRLQGTLAALGYLPDRHKARFADFIRLADRLQKIADLEAKVQALSFADMKLLANIDVVLDRVELPTAGTLPLQSPNPAQQDKIGAVSYGVNFGLGRPGQLFIILQEGTNWTLARGAVYTYYEVQGAPMTAEHWQRKLDNDLVKPAFWVERYDTVQEFVAQRKKF